MTLHNAVTNYLALLDRGDYSIRELDAARESLAAELALDVLPKKKPAKKAAPDA